MSKDSPIDNEVEARYELCKKCLGEDYRAGSAHCLSIIDHRLQRADASTQWLNPYYIEEHANIPQPLKDTICPCCPYEEEHTFRQMVSKL